MSTAEILHQSINQQNKLVDSFLKRHGLRCLLIN